MPMTRGSGCLAVCIMAVKTRDMSLIMVFADSLSTLQMWKFIHNKVADSRGRAGFALLNKLAQRTSLRFALLKYEADLCK